jgi:hypothetical protein
MSSISDRGDFPIIVDPLMKEAEEDWREGDAREGAREGVTPPPTP